MQQSMHPKKLLRRLPRSWGSPLALLRSTLLQFPNSQVSLYSLYCKTHMLEAPKHPRLMVELLIGLESAADACADVGLVTRSHLEIFSSGRQVEWA